MNYIEIADEPIEPGRAFTDKQTGMQKMLPGKQKAYLHTGDRYPVPFKIDVDQVAGPFRPGFYVMTGPCFKPGQYDRLEFDNRRVQLVPMADALKVLSGLDSKPKIAAAS